MDIRFTVGIVFIAVGALMALLGGMTVFYGVSALLGGKEGPDATFTFGCGGMGAFGVLLVVLGLRLRNRAVASSPELRRALADRGRVPTARTGTAKPRFLTKGSTPQPQPQPSNRPAVPSPAGGWAVVYWLIFGAFALVVIGLLVGTLDFFEGRNRVRALFLVPVLLFILAFPVLSLRRRRRSRR